MWFWWRGDTCNQAHTFCRFLPVMRNSHHHKDFSAFLGKRRYKNQAHKISSWEYLSEDLCCQFSQSTECLTPGLHPELLQGVSKVSCCSTWSNPWRSTWQGPVCSWQLLSKLVMLTCFNQHLVAKSPQTYFSSFLWSETSSWKKYCEVQWIDTKYIVVIIKTVWIANSPLDPRRKKYCCVQDLS